MVASDRVTTPLWLISHIGLSRIFKASFLAAATLLVSSQLALAQFSQQGPKLVGTEVGGPAIAYQGQSVALSSDGSTAIVGGPDDDRFGNGSGGAVWVFTRSNGVWTQQGSKLVANDSVGPAFQGWSVAPSADGNTAVVGGDGDNSNIGATWSTPAAAVSGRSRAVSWSAPARLEPAPYKANPSHCPPTATPPSWVGPLTTTTATAAASGRRGSSPTAAVSGPSKAASWSAAVRSEAPSKAPP
jgi:hypothetical protein